MPRYRNENTDDVVVTTAPHPRLERLPNWHRLDLPEQPEPDTQGVHTFANATPVTTAVPGLTEPAEAKPSPVSGTREQWAAYALSQGAVPADIEGMGRNELAAAYGG